MADNDDKAVAKRRKMIKRVETKDDGRLLIYYTFEGDTAAGGDNSADSDAKAVRK